MTRTARRLPIVTWLVLLATAGRADPPAAFPPELVDFGPLSVGPLFAGGGKDAWDRDLRERGWIVRAGGRWHLWYTGSNVDRDPRRFVGRATSSDGLNWVRDPATPLVRDAWVEDVCVVRQGACLQMFAEGEQDIAQRLTSRDGIHWRRHGPLDIRLVSGAPISDGPRGTPAVWFEHGTWHLFYERMDRGVWLATSRDLCTFTNVSDEPVLACGPEACDLHAVAFDQIVKYAGRYYAYYHSSPVADRSQWQTCLATSRDLVHWEKYAGNPLVPVDPEHPKRSSAMLVHDGERHRLYTSHPDLRVRFAVARSSSGSPAAAQDQVQRRAGRHRRDDAHEHAGHE